LKIEDKPYLLYVGNAYPHKNLERLLKAFKIVLEKEPSLCLVLVGEVDYFYQRLQKFAQDLDLKKKVIFTGQVQDEELAWLYQNGLAYVFPSLREGFGLPGLEAMKHGLAVVSSNRGSLPEIYAKSAYYFDPENVGEIAEVILEVIRNRNLREKLKKRGLEQAKKYSWEKCARETLEVYRGVKNSVIK